MAINYFDQLVQGFGDDASQDDLDKAIAALTTQAQVALGTQEQTPARDVRAERLASESPQVSQATPGSIEALMAGQQDMQRIQAERAAALSNLSAVGARRPSKRLLREGQSFMEAFKDPSEAQREFAIRAGMALLSDDGTKSLSQRIGQALGSGAQGLQEVRQQGIASEAAQAQAQLAQLQLQQEGVEQDIEFGQQIADLRQSATEEEREAKKFEIQEAVEQRAIEKARRDEAERIAKTGRLESVGDMQVDGVPVFENYAGDFIFATGEPLSQDQKFRMAPPLRTGVNIDPVTGQMTVGAQSREISKSDQAYFKAKQEAAANADKQLRSLNIMEDSLAQGLKTGTGTGIERGFGQVVGSIESVFGTDVPVGEDAELQNTLGRAFDTESRSLGVQGLQAFGGSDTERELLVSLSIQPSLSYTPETNRKILANKRAAIELLMQEEDFANKWLSENGSLQNKNEDGKYFRKAWMDFQRENYKAMDYTGLPKDVLKSAQMTADSYKGTSSRFDSAGRAKSDFGTDNSTVQQALRLITQ